MFGSSILEVVVGVVFVYLLLSLVCSALNEWIASWLRMRSETLRSAIRNLLNDSGKSGMAEALYDHPLIKTLAEHKGKRGPSYIPSRTFALALLDTIAPPDPAKGPKAINEVRSAATQLPDSEMKRVLLLLINEAEGDLKKVTENIMRWFDDAMERVSGWYKRRVQRIIIGLAIVVTIVSNADTLAITTSLWRDPVLRASVVASAEETARQPLSPGSDPLARVEQIREQVRALEVPLGWRSPPGDLGGWLMKILGWLFTTIALSLGASFWFDVLKGALRLAGKRPEEAKIQ